MSDPHNRWSPNPDDWSTQQQSDYARWSHGAHRLPTGSIPSDTPVPPRRRVLPWVLGGIVMTALTVSLAVGLSGAGDTPESASAGEPSIGHPVDPTPISRSDLMAEYARIAPMDRSATPEAIDDLALRTCELLRNGTASDQVITAATGVYGAEATQVVRLFVSYKCTQYLKDFK